MYYAPAQTYLGTFESIKSVMFVLQIKKEVICTDVIINGAKVVSFCSMKLLRPVTSSVKNLQISNSNQNALIENPLRTRAF